MAIRHVIIIMIATFFVTTLIVRRIKCARDASRTARNNHLYVLWTMKRKRRERWRMDNPYANFYHPEYQRLWEIELGAEALYVMEAAAEFPEEVSWQEYQDEKRDHNSEKT